MKEVALTTIDNPYSPFSQFDDWYNYDLEKGYDCCGYIDRMNTAINGIEDTNSLDDNEQIEEVIDEIVTTDPTGLFVKVEKVNNENKKDNDNDFEIVLSNKNVSFMNNEKAPMKDA